MSFERMLARRAKDGRQSAEADDLPAPGRMATSALLLRKAEGAPLDSGIVPAEIPANGGTTLGGDFRDRMETALGADLSGVNIHTGAESGAAAQSLNARAFTLGSDVHFASGQFAPGTREGDRLIAHELAHVVQTGGAAVQAKAEDEHDQVSQPDDPAEKEADAAADRAVERLYDGSDAEAPAIAAAPAPVSPKLWRKPGGGYDGLPPVAGKGPKLVSSGQEAYKLALNGLGLADGSGVTVNAGAMGSVVLTPGASVGDKILVYAGPMQCMYLSGQNLYEEYTPDFVKNVWLTSLAKGVDSAKWIIPVAKTMARVVMALLVPGAGGMIAISLSQAMLFAAGHKSEIARLWQQGNEIWPYFDALESMCPTLFRKAIWWAVKEAFSNFHKGIEFEDFAYCVARIVGAAGLAGKAEQAIEVTVKVILKTVAIYVPLVALLHSPKIGKAALEHSLKEKADELKKALESAGISVSMADARKIVDEMGKAPESEGVLKDLQRLLVPFAKGLVKLKDAWDNETV